MCFSASASFAAGAVLTAVGVASLKKTKKPSEIPFASIPLIFGLQQFTEGFLWLALTNPDYAFMEGISTDAFIFFAQVVWPVWVPLSILKFQDTDSRNIFGKVLVGIGAFVSAMLGYYLFTYPIEAEILGNHISYHQDYPEKYRLLGGILYMLATVAPPFTSSIKRMWILGSSILVSYIITEIFYSQYIVSVWCYFAAILSAMVLWIIIGKRKGSK